MGTQLLEFGISAFRSGEYETAISCLLRSLEALPDNWTGRFYLAMSYHLAGDPSKAETLFRYLHDYCPDEQIRQKTQAALSIIGHASSAITHSRHHAVQRVA